MDDLISRQEAIEEVKALPNTENGYSETYDKECIIGLLKEMPSAEPVKHEECVYIITKGKAGYNEEYKCSACGDSFYWTQNRYIPNRFNYCRNCGAKVVGFVEDMSGKETGHEGERK